MSFELGRKSAESFLRYKDSGQSPGALIISGIVNDLAPEDQDLVRGIRDLVNQPLFLAFLEARSRPKLLGAKTALESCVLEIYSPRLVAKLKLFLDGFSSKVREALPDTSTYIEVKQPQYANQESPQTIAVPDRSLVPDQAENTMLPLINESPSSSLPVKFSSSSKFPRQALLVASGIALAGIFGGIAINSFSSKISNSGGSEIIAGSGDTYEEILSRGHALLGAQAESPPMNYVEGGRRTGLDFELAKLVFRQSQFGLTSPENVYGDVNTDDYAAIPELLKKKDNRGAFNVDLVAGGLTFKDGDINDVSFTIPYLDGFGYALLTPTGSSIKEIKQLQGKKVGVVKGDPDVMAYVKTNISGANIVELDDSSESWLNDNLSPKTVDAIVYDFPFASVESKGLPVSIVIANMPGSNLEYRFGVRKGDSKLLEKLNLAIRSAKDTPQYSELLRSFLPTDNLLQPSKAGKLTYTVNTGDSLSLIAQNHLGSSSRWVELQRLNNLPNPSFISPNQQLIVPPDFK